MDINSVRRGFTLFEEMPGLAQVILLEFGIQPACIEARQGVATQRRQQLVYMVDRLAPQGSVRATHMEELVAVDATNGIEPVIVQ